METNKCVQRGRITSPTNLSHYHQDEKENTKKEVAVVVDCWAQSICSHDRHLHVTAS